MNDLLREIVAATRASLAQRPAAGGQGPAGGGFGVRRLGAALSPLEESKAAASRRTPKIIAEIKAASPSAGTIIENPDVEGIAAAYARGGAAAISVVTEPRYFRGSIDWVNRAAKSSGLPVIMKDFILDEVQIHEAAAAGASAILLIAAILKEDELRRFRQLAESHGLEVLVEVHDQQELAAALSAGASIIGVNSRDLRDFSVDLATAEKLGPMIPSSAIRVAESGIHSRADVSRLRKAGFHAFLVGESLLRQDDHERAVRHLIGPRVKICGLSTPEAAEVAVGEGASFIGLVFAPNSPRHVDPARAREVAAVVRGRASVVGVFRDQPVDEVRRITEEVALDFIQLHGNEPPAALAGMPRPVIKALTVNSSMPDPRPYAQAEWLLFDACSPGAGQRFDWELLQRWDRKQKFFLAGGLNPENIAEAVAKVQPDGVDVSSGVETAPGVKSAERIRRLFEVLR